ncbi:MAG: hypothetical protein IT545_14135 [Rhodobacteraceae bacterium]|nr:hypothetical protein [Paracoccaceae bacterium]
MPLLRLLDGFALRLARRSPAPATADPMLVRLDAIARAAAGAAGARPLFRSRGRPRAA